MRAVVALARESSIGSLARRVRTAQHLTQRELAEVAGVSQKDIDLLEHNLPVTLDVKRRLLKELWARKAKARIPA